MSRPDRETNPHLWKDYSETARKLLLVLAKVQEDHDGRFVKCTRVIRRYLEAEGQLTVRAQQALDDVNVWDQSVEAAYRVLLGLVQDDSDFRMIDGHGNFGTPHRGWLPAPPCYTEISLSDRGQQMVAENSIA